MARRLVRYRGRAQSLSRIRHRAGDSRRGSVGRCFAPLSPRRARIRVGDKAAAVDRRVRQPSADHRHDAWRRRRHSCSRWAGFPRVGRATTATGVGSDAYPVKSRRTSGRRARLLEVGWHSWRNPLGPRKVVREQSAIRQTANSFHTRWLRRAPVLHDDCAE
jgi:hypothetical protein